MIKNLILFICILTLFFLVSSSEIFASETIFEDDFSNGFEKWQFVRDNGYPWTIINGMSNAYVSNKFSITEAVPKDEYWVNSISDMEYSLDILPLNGVDRNISFSFENLSSWCEIHFVGNNYYLAQIKNNVLMGYFSGPASLATNQTNHLTIRKSKDTISIFINNNLVGTHKSEFFNDAVGKIGIKAGTGAVSPTVVRFDNILVRTLDDEILPVPDQKQTNPQWSDEEYDSAHNWSVSPTISRWGCALTSLSMVLNYHQILNFSDGTSITPSTLNTWLINQPDGYIGNGLINWIAVTRLSRIISEKYGTTKLEYGKSITNHFQKAVEEIENARPVILQTPGHFLVGKGVKTDHSDLYINDPLSDKNIFADLNQQLTSARSFVPSHTDLSYLLFLHTKELEVNITDSEGNQIPSLDTFDDAITQLNPSEQIPLQVIHHLPKPVDGKYMISVKQNELKPFKLEIYSYDQLANVVPLHQQGLVGNNEITFELSYPENTIKVINPNCSFEKFKQALDLSYQQKYLRKNYAFSHLNRIATYAQNASATKAERYTNFLKNLLNYYQYAMDENTHQYLLSQLCQFN